MSGCISYKNIVSYQHNLPAEPHDIKNPPAIVIQPNDVLDIKVYAADATAAAPFNLGPLDYNWTFGNLESLQLNGYLVDPQGGIDFPILGSINLNGLTTVQAKDTIAQLLTSYIRDPVVNIRFLNFKITVSGEVVSPGTFTVVNERITLPEAISRAGDMTNYADRRNILIIRETDNIRSFNRINLQSPSIFDSDFYYLRQNDLIYIEPLKAKTGAIGDQTNETISFVVGSATLIAVIVSILK